MEITLHADRIEDYRLFLRIKALPKFRFVGRTAIIPDEYASRLGLDPPPALAHALYTPSGFLFDYQRDVAALSICKQKFAVFMDMGYGKTLILLEYARHVTANLPLGQCALIVSPLMVIPQTIAEANRFYGGSLPIEQVHARDLACWLESGTAPIGITNYEALKADTPAGRLGCLILDESSMLKSAYGKQGQYCLRLGRGLNWKLALTGTPAPNDRIEFANHAVFLDAFLTTNSFLARFFVNRGQTNERWEMKPHAIRPFYRALSHWSIFMTDPATYGWRDNTEDLPPIHIHIHDVALSAEQEAAVRAVTGQLFVTDLGGIVSRSKLSRLAKGRVGDVDVPTLKPAFIRGLVDSCPGESVIIWCRYNAEQDLMEQTFPDAASIAGATPHARRMELIDDFKARRRRVLISKPALLGFGLNLQVATRQIWSGIQDSYEEFVQGVKRSNRVGSTKPLHVHVPVTEIERPLIDNVLRKAARVQADATEQERIFQEEGYAGL